MVTRNGLVPSTRGFGTKESQLPQTAVSLGYDKVRFLGPVFIGDTVTLTYTITEVDPLKRRSRSDIKMVNQKGELVGVAQHILAWVKDGA